MIDLSGRLRRFLSLFCVLAISSCEKDIDFKYEETTLTSVDFEVCATQACPKIDVSYVNFKNPKPLDASVSNWTFQTISSTLNQEEKQLIGIKEIFQTFINDSQIGYPETTVLSDAHELTVEVEVMHTSNEVVSLAYYSDLFDGGAHGFYQELYANFNPKSGELLHNRALVNEQFYAFAKAKFSQAYPNNVFEITPSTLTRDHVLQLGFTATGLVLRYDDPNMFPIAEEEYKITVPWEEAEDYLTF